MAGPIDDARNAAPTRPLSRPLVLGAVAAVLIVAIATVLVARSRSSSHPKAIPVSTTSAPASTTSSSAFPTTSGVPLSSVSSTSTTAPASPGRALFPTYLPTGVGTATLWVYDQSHYDGGYTQSYYGTPDPAGTLPELVIEERPAGMGPTAAGHIGSRPVRMWRMVTPTFSIIGVTAKVAGRDVTLIGALSEGDLGAVLDGLGPRVNAPGWNTSALPAGLRLVAQGDRNPKSSVVTYLLRFGPVDVPRMQISVTPGALVPEDTCACNPGMRGSLKLTTINGIPAVLIDSSDVEGVPGSDFSVEWQYGPDVVASVSVHGFDERDAVRVASSLAPAGRATWDALACVDAGHGRAPCSPERVVPTSG